MRLPPIHPAARRHPHTHLLVWHDIVPSQKLVWFDTSVAELDAQLDRLARAGARPIPLESLERWLTRGEDPPPPGAVVLCFDDNTVGIYEHALPALQKRGWPFAVSAHTAFVGVRTGKAHNSWEQLAELARGGARIVSQTHSHPPDLRTLTDARLAREMALAKASMAKHLGTAPRWVTYPSGKWDTRVAAAAGAAGYTLALTEDFGAAESSPHCLGVRRWSTHRRFDEALRAVQASSRRA